jgi:hypothetical protein
MMQVLGIPYTDGRTLINLCEGEGRGGESGGGLAIDTITTLN